MSQSIIDVVHVRVTMDKPFQKFAAALERQLGRFDPDVYQELEKGGDPAAVKARLEAMVGPSGFMLFKTSNHGALLGMLGQPRKAIQYIVGNPLFAVEMTRHAIGAGPTRPARAGLRGPARQDRRGIRPADLPLRAIP